MKLVTVLGARPQFIKAGSVSRHIMKQRENGCDIEEIIVHTGQHYDRNMSDVFFEEMKIPRPDYHLGIGGKSHGAMTGQMLEKIEEILLQERPDLLMVYGDTDSTLAGALAAVKLHIPIAHVEAGLRSFNMNMPEEINRILTDRISEILFCPTDSAVENLKTEGFKVDGSDERATGFGKVLKVGDVMQDGAMFYRSFARRPSVLDAMNDFVLCTIHRAENTDDDFRLRNIVEAIEEVAKSVEVVLPLHPRTRKKLSDISITPRNVTIIDPIGYLEMIWLLDNCSLVMTDSGGLQKEAFFFKKPCITFRDETEWIELVENQFNILVGADKKRAIEAFENARFNRNFDMPLYGGGKASQRIVSYLCRNGVADELA